MTSLKKNKMISTPRLNLIPRNTELLQEVLQGSKSVANFLQVKVPDNWTENGAEVFQFVLEKLAEEPKGKNWWTYLTILKGENKLIGSGGFKGVPGENGMVEIGYETCEDYRLQGLATELANGQFRS